MRPLRLLTFTTLFPNPERPNHGIFVENRLRHLLGTGEAVSTVIAPVPWFPSGWHGFGGWAGHARVPAAERRDGLEIIHPRFAVIPRIGMSLSPALLYAAGARALGRIIATGARFDAIDAHYLYPDGVAAIRLGRRFDLPVVLTARGSDVTQLPGYALPRLLIRRAIARADGIIAVSEGLRRALLALGPVPGGVTVLRNGVDLDRFRPLRCGAEREAVRQQLGLDGPTLLSVGALIPRKRHELAIAALRELPEWRLLILGEGPERARLEAAAAASGVGARVRLLGGKPHAELARFYGAADAMVLASSREGWANVLLESIACGTPVIASDIPGNTEVVRRPEAGLIMAQNTPAGLAAAVRSLFAAPPRRAATRAYAEQFGWEETSRGQLALFRRLLAAPRSSSGVSASQPAARAR